MVVQELSPHTTPLFVSTVRLLPAGAVLVAWATYEGRPQPRTLAAWFAIALFGLADATCFQVSLCSCYRLSALSATSSRCSMKLFSSEASLMP